ncbi:MAG TPA: AmmeMemoRadiSam system protein B [Bacteroidales bacterium]|nr:AmmeMemoRadiSam system protein B [Bacteroidales bacterium]HSA43363.1 AmmeMemoRadiSam system protein B [Bacteroidales bacterium]
MMIFCSSGNGDHSGDDRNKKNRLPYAAGRFYTGDSAKLRTELDRLFREAEPCKVKNVLAVVSPHAGYVYSGEVAASAFSQIDRNRHYRNVFVIASSHREYFDGASIYYPGDYMTPLGRVQVDQKLAASLAAEHGVFRYSPDFHDQEHSLEVQLPFLQYLLGNEINLVPIIIGTDKAESCRHIAAALKPYFNHENLFVISTDFSHYPAYADAVTVDHKTARAILSNNPETLLKTLRENERSGTKGLATSLCGHSSVLTLLYLSSELPGTAVHEIQYKNSGDSPYGEKDRVVGYFALAVTAPDEKPARQQDEFRLTAADKDQLLKLARHTLESYLKTGDIPAIEGTVFSEQLKTHAGAFVTLKKNNNLRGCIGRFDPDDPLYMVVQRMAIAAAVEDTRFPKVTFEELKKIHIEISVLTPMRKITNPEEIVLGRHGIYIRKGYRSGTFLPQVATETGWSVEEYLGHCSRDKAGIGWDGWKDADIFVYEALVFEE